jgi:PAS domain S-box-containing protein
MDLRKGIVYQILLIDDDEEDFILTKLLLNESTFSLPDGGEVSFNLNWKSSYEDAVQAMEQDYYDAYLVDMHLEGHTGLDILITANRLNIRAPIIILTGKESYETDLEAARAGASDYLVKGHINAQLLERSIRYSIERKQAEDKFRQSNEEALRLTEQLRQANRKLAEAARDELRRAEELNAVLSSMNEAVIVFNQDSLPHYANTEAVKVLNLASDTFSQNGVSFELFEYPKEGERLDKDHLPWKRALRGEKVTEEHYLLKNSNGQYYSVMVSASPIEMEGKPMGAVMVWRDLTEREQLMAQIAEERGRLSKVIATAPIAFLVTDGGGVIIFANPAAESLFGGQLLWQDLNIFNDIRFRMPKGGTFEIENFPLFLSLNKGETHISYELELVRSDTEILTLLMNSSPIVNRNGKISGAVAIFQDITQHRIHEEESRRKALRIEVQHHLIQYQEKERLTIARDLHDGPLQDLIGIQYQVSRLINQVKKLPSTIIDAISQQGLIQSLDSIQLGLMGQIQEIRNFSSALRPPSLAAYGLEKAIRAHAEKLSEQHPDIFIYLNLEPDGQRMDEKVRLAFYRIYQELISNVIRHSDADEVIITFSLEDNNACLVVQDDGNGFKIPDNWINVIRDGHMGLVGVQERAEAIGGTVVIKSDSSSGTHITISAPIK